VTILLLVAYELLIAKALWEMSRFTERAQWD
jgi:hypothetical protein